MSDQELKLEHGNAYKNRLGVEVTVNKDNDLSGYPFRDKLGIWYDNRGRVWSGKESNYDLIEQTQKLHQPQNHYRRRAMSEQKIHHLKTWPEYFEDILIGNKNFEVRRDDRDFSVGDRLALNEWDPQEGRYTGRDLEVKIVYKLEGGSFGIKNGYCVLGLADNNQTKRKPMSNQPPMNTEARDLADEVLEPETFDFLRGAKRIRVKVAMEEYARRRLSEILEEIEEEIEKTGHDSSDALKNLVNIAAVTGLKRAKSILQQHTEE